MSALHHTLLNLPPVPTVIISVALMLFSGFLLTRITKLLRLPNVTAYIVAGILIGPFGLNLVPQNIIEGTDFLSDIALAFIAFSTGEFFKLSVLKKNGMKVVWITVLESVMASVAVFILTYWVLGLELAFSIVLSALASATAPASTMMTIRQTGAKGDFVNTLLQVVALDDVVGLVLYSMAISVALASLGGGSFTVFTLVRPILLNLLVMALGGTFGVLMKLLMPSNRSTDNKLIISIALLFSFCGICALLDVSPLLGCMAMGTVYTNIAENDKLFRQLGYFSPPILLLFFVAGHRRRLFSGAHPGQIPGGLAGLLGCGKNKAGAQLLRSGPDPPGGGGHRSGGSGGPDSGRQHGRGPADHHSGFQCALRTHRPRLRQAGTVPFQILLQLPGRFGPGGGNHRDRGTENRCAAAY